MNKQAKYKTIQGVRTLTGRGIEWCDVSWNPVGGCFHGCRWVMPDGKVAVCYAETNAKGVAGTAYPKGFEHHYWHPERLAEPKRHKEPLKIFGDSMADWMGHWVPDAQVSDMLNVMHETPWHTYIMLTKNAPRLLKFKDHFPKNCWLLTSTPPDYFRGHPLSLKQQKAMLFKQMEVLAQMTKNVTGLSAEPLSWDITQVLEEFVSPVDWIIIGAASNGKIHYQPNPDHVNELLTYCDVNNVRVFFKGNLEWSCRMEEFPDAL